MALTKLTMPEGQAVALIGQERHFGKREWQKLVKVKDSSVWTVYALEFQLKRLGTCIRYFVEPRWGRRPSKKELYRRLDELILGSIMLAYYIDLSPAEIMTFLFTRDAICGDYAPGPEVLKVGGILTPGFLNGARDFQVGIGRGSEALQQGYDGLSTPRLTGLHGPVKLMLVSLREMRSAVDYRREHFEARVAEVERNYLGMRA